MTVYMLRRLLRYFAIVAHALSMQRSPAFPRNRGPIAEAMDAAGFDTCARILELGCGPGEHAVDFAARWPSAVIQPTDCDPSSLASVDAYAANAGCDRVLRAARVDVSERLWPAVEDRAYDGCYSINVIHIMPKSAIAPFFAGAGRALKPGGLLGLYDGWTFGGEYIGPTADRFDASLRSQGYGGLASIEECDAAAAAAGLDRTDVRYLPANNQFVVYTKR